VYLLAFHAYVKEMHGSRSKIPNKKSRPYIYTYDVKFLALLGAPYIYDISRLRVKQEHLLSNGIKVKNVVLLNTVVWQVINKNSSILKTFIPSFYDLSRFIITS
jgi:hypothetical protein